jgi:isopentenyl phosphate kinase
MDELIFLKLGGSLITDKSREATAREGVIRRAAREITDALETRPDLRLLVGHGSGSFGHFVARRHGLLEGGPPNWQGYAETGAAAARLNRLVTDIFLAGGVPVVSIQPSASARCWDGELIGMETEPIELVLQHGLVPLVYGDVALDEVRGCTIISTEQIFAHLAHHLEPARILLAGEVHGVFSADPLQNESAHLIPEISRQNFDQVEHMLAGSFGVDVTGGMLTKVRIMCALVREQSELKVHLISGHQPGMIKRALLAPDLIEGTTIRYER